MPVYKDTNGSWYAMVRYDDWQGKRKQKCKRGFSTKREAQNWERSFLLQSSNDLDMTFSSFYEIYANDMRGRLKETTWSGKEHIIRTKILPYFGDKPISEIKSKDVLAWQNELLRHKNKNGKPYSETYLKTVHNQISAIFNHAVRFYNLPSNPAAKAGSIGVKNAKEMSFWTKAEYLQFAEAVMDKPRSYYAFELLYWCGLRVGELLALTSNDIDLDKGTITVNKSYQRIRGREVVTPPKTAKSVRTIRMPDFLCEEMKNYLELALNVADECNYHKEMGILLRLKGLNMIMQGDFKEAERLLRESISTFMVTQSVQRRYALNIAGAYNYLGEVRRGQGRLQEALDFYKEAMRYASDQDAYSSWVVFSCNAGIVCYEQGQYDMAKRYFMQAYELFPRYNFYWRHPIVEAYLALLSMREKKEKDAGRFLDDALAKLGNMNNPREAGYVYMVIAMIKHRWPGSAVSSHYPGSMSSYATRALQSLDQYRDAWERQELEKLFCITRR